jgi:membrane-bound ClpP family serine protease
LETHSPGYRRRSGFGAKDEIGKFSPWRWGPGGLLVLAIMLSLGSILLFEWFVSRSPVFLFTAVIMFLLGGVVFAVKIFEEIEPYHRELAGIVDSPGTVVRKVKGTLPGVVKVKGQLWSAKSDQVLEVGESVRVKKVDGLYVWVEKKTPEAPEGNHLAEH